MAFSRRYRKQYRHTILQGFQRFVKEAEMSVREAGGLLGRKAAMTHRVLHADDISTRTTDLILASQAVFRTGEINWEYAWTLRDRPVLKDQLRINDWKLGEAYPKAPKLFEELRGFDGTADSIAELTGVHMRTALDWLAGNRLPDPKHLTALHNAGIVSRDVAEHVLDEVYPSINCGRYRVVNRMYLEQEDED